MPASADVVDFRSDTLTRPTPGMREAMARAEVGDDVYGEDPTVNRLQERIAALLGKEAALYVPSGTMANQIALHTLAQAGDEVLVSSGAHCLCYESGAAAGLSGIGLREIGGADGRFTLAEVEAAVNPDNPHYPPTRAIAVENSHNRAGGRIFPERALAEIVAFAKRRGIALHLDGARLWNVHVATGRALAELAAPFDTVSVCLSKGLGAPVGSLIASSRERIGRAHRRRKMLGGGMRQAGLLAAAGLYALDHHLQRLKDDHENAKRLAETLARAPGFAIDPATCETNIVAWELLPEVPLDAAEFVERARARGVLLNAMGPRRVRAVTHLDVDAAACARGAERIVEVAKSA